MVIRLSKSPLKRMRAIIDDRLVKSCGLHRIASTVFSPAPAPNPFLRNRPYLLPPPEDALELGERIHTLYIPFFFLAFSSTSLTTLFDVPTFSSPLSRLRFTAGEMGADRSVGRYFPSIEVLQP